METSEVVVVTGAAQGIGFAIAQGFAGQGARVVVADRRGSEAAAAKLGGMGHDTDVSDAASVDAMVAAVMARYGRIAPARGGAVSSAITRLAGNNFAVRREILAGDDRDVHESEVAARIRSFGRASVEVSGATVRYERGHGLREAVGDRVRFGFGFGRLCAGSSTPTRRLLRIVLGPGILVSQVGRLLRTLVKKRQGGAMLLRSGPVVLGLLTAWSAAEWLGWLVGPSRTSDAGQARKSSPRAGRHATGPSDCTPASASS